MLQIIVHMKDLGLVKTQAVFMMIWSMVLDYSE